MNESDLYQVARVVAPPEQVQGNMFILPPNGAPVMLHWDNLDVAKLPRYVHIRIMAAQDDNEEKWVEAFWPTTGEPLRAFDIRYARQFQLFAITVERADAERIAHEGLGLRLDDGTTPLYLSWKDQRLYQSMKVIPISDVRGPHIVNIVNIASNPPSSELYNRLISQACIQQFGGATGIVLNGMADLGNAGVVDRQALFLYANLHRTRENQTVSDGQDAGQLLAWAMLTMLASEPTSSGFTILAERSLEKLDQTILTPQSAYLHSYPLAILARTLNRPELAERALAILREVSQQKLGSWSRDVGLYLLGLVRTLLELPTVDEALRAEVERLCAWVVQYQSKPGLWATYVDDLKTPPDTMGTAAIATALALAYTKKLVPTRYTTEVNNAVQVLKQFLTPDGFLTGAAPLYADEALQRSDYRVISQVGMGFFAQLLATSKIFRA
jgi:hypothetical protein